ncbi:hypothetical protein E2C01_070758 [Portunus trituberculatus]|uniref:Uncharacterized protein n=1 Tax=Portunus trituberculatus TaxID=210409 RepID=A0A5B7I650_PORTR|nr:hypothetical protein [Portunus trituberculatus]
MWSERSTMPDDPLSFAITVTTQANTHIAPDHSLAVETGRWNRRGRGRLLVEQRLCSCDQIQTERHVVEDSRLTENTLQVYNTSRLEDLFNDSISSHEARAIIHEILEIFK